MTRIGDHAGVFIEKGGFRLLELNAALLPVGAVLAFIPFEARVTHASSITTM
jgi:hypothetical protein